MVLLFGEFIFLGTFHTIFNIVFFLFFNNSSNFLLVGFFLWFRYWCISFFSLFLSRECFCEKVQKLLSLKTYKNYSTRHSFHSFCMFFLFFFNYFFPQYKKLIPTHDTKSFAKSSEGLFLYFQNDSVFSAVLVLNFGSWDMNVLLYIFTISFSFMANYSFKKKKIYFFYLSKHKFLLIDYIIFLSVFLSPVA